MGTTSHPTYGSLQSTPPEAWEPLRRLARFASRPLERFLSVEASSGILLLGAAALALAWANSPWAATYIALWHTPVGLRLGDLQFEATLEWVVNDGLMVIFFFLVGLEIRRELHQGELCEWRRAALPMAAALGGMVMPALWYLALAGSGPMRVGWGVPMATDIAFALGILKLLGHRVPSALRVLLLALAVIDDLGAILVIALFYASGFHVTGLLVAALGLFGISLMKRFGVRRKLLYVPPALLVWAGTYAGGVHPTIAGVIVGLATPVRAWIGRQGFVDDTRRQLQDLAEERVYQLSSHDLAVSLRNFDVLRREALSPVESLIESLHPWVAYGIMPVFALANAGVQISSESESPETTRVMLSVATALMGGKLLGILLASWSALRLRLAQLPAGITLRHLTLLGIVAGIGFTMALFIANLAFGESALLPAAKLGVLAASGLAATCALGLGMLLLAPPPSGGVEQSADEAECASAE